MPKIVIRPAAVEELPELLAIYAPYVENTTVSAEYHAPSLEEFQHRYHTYTANTPWLICRIDGEAAGYAYASPHRTRAAYQWSVETSIYVDEKFHRRGVARALYSALFALLAWQGYYNIFVGITSPNERSVAFHTAMGFTPSGSYHNSMYKFGQWHDVGWMAKALRRHDADPQPSVPFPQLQDNPSCLALCEEAAQGISQA